MVHESPTLLFKMKRPAREKTPVDVMAIGAIAHCRPVKADISLPVDHMQANVLVD
jgi:hypothetical protein